MININDFSDLEIIARTAYGENRGGATEGMQSVLNVIANRAAKKTWFGHSLREVCLKPYQFSCWLPHDPNYTLLTGELDHDPIFIKATDLAQQSIYGILPDITDGATYYFAKGMKVWPHWAVGHFPCADIQGQYFFNDIG